jgi:hypothetical protein
MQDDAHVLDFRPAQVVWADGTEDDVEAAVLYGWLCISAPTSTASYPSERVQKIIWKEKPSLGVIDITRINTPWNPSRLGAESV